MSTATKPGRHGTLYLYRIAYTDSHDQGCPTFASHLWAYSADHAVDRFNDTDDAGWRIISIQCVQAAP